LRLNVSTFSDTQQILRDYGFTQFPDASIGNVGEQSYSTIIYNERLNKFTFRHHWLWWFGVKPYGAVANLRFRNERLSFISYSVGAGITPPSGWATDFEAEVSIEKESNYKESFHIHTEGMISHGA